MRNGRQRSGGNTSMHRFFSWFLGNRAMLQSSTRNVGVTMFRVWTHPLHHQYHHQYHHQRDYQNLWSILPKTYNVWSSWHQYMINTLPWTPLWSDWSWSEDPIGSFHSKLSAADWLELLCHHRDTPPRWRRGWRRTAPGGRHRGERWRQYTSSPHLLTSSLLCLLSGLIDRWTVAEMSLHKWFMSTHMEQEEVRRRRHKRRRSDTNRWLTLTVRQRRSWQRPFLSHPVSHCLMTSHSCSRTITTVCCYGDWTVFVIWFLSCGRILWCHSSVNLWPLATKM